MKARKNKTQLSDKKHLATTQTHFVSRWWQMFARGECMHTNVMHLWVKPLKNYPPQYKQRANSV